MDMHFPPDHNMARATTVIVASNRNREKVVGVCEPVDTVSTFSIGVPAQHYLMQYEGKHPMDVDISKVTLKLLEIVRQPKHGRLFMDDNDPYGSGAYHPNKGYLGKDRVEAIFSVGKDIVRVIYTFVVQTEAVDSLMSRDDSTEAMKKLCPKGSLWKISEPSIVEQNYQLSSAPKWEAGEPASSANPLFSRRLGASAPRRLDNCFF